MFLKRALASGALVGLAGHVSAWQSLMPFSGPMYRYRLSDDKSAGTYDEALAVACLQGLVNRERPVVYVTAAGDSHPDYWLTVLSQPGDWLAGRVAEPLNDLDALFTLARAHVKGIIVWDEAVAATVNVATTIAGVEDGVVLSPALFKTYGKRWKLPVIDDLRGRFTGRESGSAKNDAYRWAIRNFLKQGRCATHWMSLYEDAFFTRAKGDVRYVVTRDWAVTHRSFVFDLSPWGDERPADDLHQPLGTDLQTYRQMLQAQLDHTAGREMTEVSGFFSFSKYSNVPGHQSAHDPVPTEWETVYLISPYNCYQNTVAESCFNQSFHSHAPFSPLRQHRPEKRLALEDKTYVCILMADYDSTTPLYAFMPKHWADPRRGEIPLMWGLDPNLVETYPDIIRHLYETATPNDYFAADASAAGYMNPNRIQPQYLDLFIRHNRKFYQQLDMTISPMVLDWDEPSSEVKDAFTRFSPDGYATIIMDLHQHGGKAPRPQVWKGMAVANLDNSTCNFSDPATTAHTMSRSIVTKGQHGPAFHIFRIVWTDPGKVIDSLSKLRHLRPDIDLEVVDPYNFFRLFSQVYART